MGFRISKNETFRQRRQDSMFKGKISFLREDNCSSTLTIINVSWIFVLWLDVGHLLMTKCLLNCMFISMSAPINRIESTALSIFRLSIPANISNIIGGLGILVNDATVNILIEHSDGIRTVQNAQQITVCIEWDFVNRLIINADSLLAGVQLPWIVHWHRTNLIAQIQFLHTTVGMPMTCRIANIAAFIITDDGAHQAIIPNSNDRITRTACKYRFILWISR